MKAKLKKLETKLESLVTKNNKIVEDQNLLDEEKTDLEIQGKSTTRLESKMYTLIEKEAVNLEAQKETRRLIKNLQQKIYRSKK